MAMPDPPTNPAGRARRLFAWWYLCIGVGFILLGSRAWLAGAVGWTVALRFVIASGFLAIGVAELRATDRGARR